MKGTLVSTICFYLKMSLKANLESKQPVTSANQKRLSTITRASEH